MEVEYKEKALRDRDYWIKRGDEKIQHRISELIVDICEHPFTGIGKPEPLKYELSGLWSRRITRNHRLMYEVLNGRISVVSMRGHYL